MKKLALYILILLILFGCEEKVVEKTPENEVVEKDDKETVEKETPPVEEETPPAEEETPPVEEEIPEVLTIENSEDMKYLIESGENDYEFTKQFSEKYKGREIEFDGSIHNVANYNDYKTRFNILIYAVDYDPEDGGSGPSFQIQNTTGQLMSGTAESLDSLTEEMNVRFRGIVVEFNEMNGLFELKPVSTIVR